MRNLLLIFVIACGGAGSRPEQPTPPDDKRVTCGGADVAVTSSAQCESSGACYQLPDGTWCTSTWHRYRW